MEKSNCFHVSYHLSFHLYIAGEDQLFSQEHDVTDAHQENWKPKESHCQPMCFQPMKNRNMAKLHFKELQYQKSLMLPLIEKNCNAKMSCISLSRSIFSQISYNKWRLCLQWFCSSITTSMIITALQNKQQKSLISRQIYGEWNTFKLNQMRVSK